VEEGLGFGVGWRSGGWDACRACAGLWPEEEGGADKMAPPIIGGRRWGVPVQVGE
jgi:hypothetical protein